MKKALLAVASVLMLAAAGCSSGQYPARQLTLVVPYGAGGTADVVGRQLAQQMSVELGKAIAVVNQAGASGSLGCKTVLDDPADGYTLLLAADSLGTQRVMGISEMSSDDFTPIMVAANDPKLIVVGKDSPYTDMQALADDMQARPGKVRMSHTGPGGSGHVQGLIYEKFGMCSAMTAYGSGSECVLAVLSGQVDFTNANLSTVRGYLESGDLRALAISAGERLEAYPALPALTELFPDMQPYLELPFSPLSVMVRSDTPAEVVERLRKSAQYAVTTPEWEQFVEQNSLDKLYEQYPDEQSARAFYKRFESAVSWLIFDAGAGKRSPEEFGVARAQ